jgi:hypothetical protein
MEYGSTGDTTVIHTLACELESASDDLEYTADELRRGAGIECAEAAIHNLTQRLSLLGTASICLETGNTDHANRILEYVSEHKLRAAIGAKQALIRTASYPLLAGSLAPIRSELCLAGSQTE